MTFADATSDVTYTLGAHIENLVGSDHNDTLTGNSSNNTIDGGDGDDFVDGAAELTVLPVGPDRTHWQSTMSATRKPAAVASTRCSRRFRTPWATGWKTASLWAPAASTSLATSWRTHSPATLLATRSMAATVTTRSMAA